MSGLPREVIKWLQSLDLTYSIKNVRRDFSNGYLIAEILAWYYPQDIEMHSFSNGTSLQTKLGNWQQLERFFTKEKLDVAKEFIEGTIHCKPGAANTLLERVYSLLTNRILHYLPAQQHPCDFSDSTYQTQLPPYARSTAAKSIKNNIASTELTTEPDRIVCMHKAETIMQQHFQQRKQEKEEFPDRFGLRTKSKKVAGDEHATVEGESIPEIQVQQRQPGKVTS